jgi:hypothetical protein
MPQITIDLLNKGIKANLSDPYRQGNLVHIPAKGSLIVSGDIHGHQRNLERIITFSELACYPDRHVVLHEIIHGGPQGDEGSCLSYTLLLEAIKFKIQFPDQVHFILGNHDTAFITDAEVMKEGRPMNQALCHALEQQFHSAWRDVKTTLQTFLLSQALAVRTANRIWISHSLPADRLIDQFDPAILDRRITTTDCMKPGSAYILTWGRNMSQALLDRLSALFDANLFIVGHQPQESGWAIAGHNVLILASDHNHGCVVQIDLTKSYTLKELSQTIIPLSSIT